MILVVKVKILSAIENANIMICSILAEASVSDWGCIDFQNNLRKTNFFLEQ